MKTSTRILLAATGLTLAALPLLTAGDVKSDTAARHPRLRAFLAHRHAVRQRVAHRLGLTAEQITQLRTDRAKTVTAVKSIRADTNLTPNQKKTQVRDALKATRNEMLSVLTPEQQAKLRDLRARFRARE